MTSRVVLATACLIVTAAVVLIIQSPKDQLVQLSEKPARVSSKQRLQALPGIIGLNLQIPFSSLRQALVKATDTPQTGTGEKQTCKKILFNNVCATLLWNYTISRSGAPTVTRHQNMARLSVPLALAGSASIDGKSAKILGLKNKKITADLLLNIDVNTKMQPDWCPTLHSDLSYRWIEEPQINIAGNLRINLRRAADKALKKNLQKFNERLSNSIDCDKFRERLKQQWKVHQIPLSIEGAAKSFFNVTPISAHIGDSQTLDHALNIAVELQTSTEMSNSALPPAPLVLPELSASKTGGGVVEFSALLKLPYDEINHQLKDILVTNDTTNDKLIID